jgi:predicted DNA-binding transcriptional regulator YafY
MEVYRMSNKTHRLLQLINLLNHRQFVTLETIRETCKIPERTAYRSLNDISEVDVPVYFDKELRAYRLTDRRATGLEDLSASDAVLVAGALKVLKRFVNDEYSSEIDRLLTKVLVRQEHSVEDGLPIIDQHALKISRDDVMTEPLSSALIHTAIASNREVQITTANNGSRDSLKLKNPALSFKGNWRLHGRRQVDTTVTDVAKIRRVKIL